MVELNDTSETQHWNEGSSFLLNKVVHWTKNLRVEFRSKSFSTNVNLPAVQLLGHYQDLRWEFSLLISFLNMNSMSFQCPRQQTPGQKFKCIFRNCYVLVWCPPDFCLALTTSREHWILFRFTHILFPSNNTSIFYGVIDTQLDFLSHRFAYCSVVYSIKPICHNLSKTFIFPSHNYSDLMYFGFTQTAMIVYEFVY